MKYRMLTKEELEQLEPDFIQFLSANTVTGPDWIKVKKESPERAEELIGLFSDIVFDKTLERVSYLEHRTPTELRCFHCKEEEIKMLGLIANQTKNFSFQEALPPNEMMAKIKEEGGSIQFFSAEKKYKMERKMELFKMMENGCLISKGELYNTLLSVQPR